MGAKAGTIMEGESGSPWEGGWGALDAHHCC